MTATPLGFIHRFEPGEGGSRPPLLLLHGTGGNEHDLMPIGRLVAPGASLLSPRGQVLENGMPRFFRRLAEGVFDEDDVRARAVELAAFIAEAREAYNLEAPLALGFSNGANIAAAILYDHPGVFAGAVLIRAMVPLAAPPSVRLDGTPVLILSGAADPIIPAANSGHLAAALKGAGVDVDHHIVQAGHGVTQADVQMTSEWLRTRW